MFKKIAGFGIPFLFILPIVGFITSLFDIKSKRSAFVYIAFAMLFGYAISFSDTSSDSYRYAQAFKNFDNTLNYNNIVQLYQNGELRDLYRLLLFYFVSTFSNNPKVMYAFAGLIYGIFSYLALRIFVTESESKNDRYVLILAVVFYTFVPLTNINGFRFHTGSLILFYSIYNLIIRNNNIWLIGIFITPLFHYGFMLIVPVILFYKSIAFLLSSKEKVSLMLFYCFIVAFIASWFLKTNSINIGFLSESNLISGEVANRVNYINSADVANLVEKRKDDSLFLGVQKYFEYAIKIFILISVLLVKDLINRMTGDKTEYTRLFAFVLFFYTFSLIALSIPSGGRFIVIAHLFLVLLLTKLYIIYQETDLKKIIVLAPIVFSFQIAFINFMAPSLFLSSTFWYGNLFWIIIEGWGFDG